MFMNLSLFLCLSDKFKDLIRYIVLHANNPVFVLGKKRNIARLRYFGDGGQGPFDFPHLGCTSCNITRFGYKLVAHFSLVLDPMP